APSLSTRSATKSTQARAPSTSSPAKVPWIRARSPERPWNRTCPDSGFTSTAHWAAAVGSRLEGSHEQAVQCREQGRPTYGHSRVPADSNRSDPPRVEAAGHRPPRFRPPHDSTLAAAHVSRGPPADRPARARRANQIRK